MVAAGGRCKGCLRSMGSLTNAACLVSLKPTPILQAQEEADRLMAPQMPFRVEQVSPPPVASSA